MKNGDVSSKKECIYYIVNSSIKIQDGGFSKSSRRTCRSLAAHRLRNTAVVEPGERCYYWPDVLFGAFSTQILKIDLVPETIDTRGFDLPSAGFIRLVSGANLSSLT